MWVITECWVECLVLSHMSLLVKYVYIYMCGVCIYLTENHNLNVLIYSPL